MDAPHNFMGNFPNPNNHPLIISRGTSIASDSDNEAGDEAVVDVEVYHVAPGPRVQTVDCSELLSENTVDIQT